MVAITEFRDYFDALDGNATWETLGPHFDNVFHDDLVVVTANGDVDRAGWAGVIKGLIAAGAKATEVDMHADANGEIHYSLVLTKNDGTSMQVASTASILDGKVVRVVPLDPAKYAAMAAAARS